MVQFMKSGNRSLEPDMVSFRDKVPVKLEIEDSLEEEHGPFSKRSKTTTTFSPVCGIAFSSSSLRIDKMKVLYLTYEVDEHLSCSSFFF